MGLNVILKPNNNVCNGQISTVSVKLTKFHALNILLSNNYLQKKHNDQNGQKHSEREVSPD